MNMGKLWDKGYSLDPTVEAFITGSDYLYDHLLLPADCIASMAHTQTLLKASLLSREEASLLINGLVDIYERAHNGTFIIEAAMEDCHTAIEQHLSTGRSSSVIDAGEKIHLGRSRNDQVQAALRLFYKEFIFRIQDSLLSVLELIHTRAKETRQIPMPGRSHLRIAMPSSVGLWFAAYAEQLIDDMSNLQNAFNNINRSPLGSAAGYGSPLPLDRSYTAELLGFSSVQNNVIAVQNSRGRLELTLLFSLGQIAITLSRLAEDVILFSLPEFGYFSLPDSLCSGSSIMPQKKNPDPLELLRSKAGFFTGAASNLSLVLSKLPSGYQRDLQESKIVTMQGLNSCLTMLNVSKVLIQELQINSKNLKAAFSPEIYATDHAYTLALKGIPFRSAYKKAALQTDTLSETYTPEKCIQNRTMIGSAGNPNFHYITETVTTLKEKIVPAQLHFFKTIKKLLSLSHTKVTAPDSVLPAKELRRLLV